MNKHTTGRSIGQERIIRTPLTGNPTIEINISSTSQQPEFTGQERKEIIVNHGSVEHNFGEPCKECMEIIMDNPYGKQAIAQARKDTIEEIKSKFIEKDGESGWSRTFNVRFLDYLDQLLLSKK